MARFRIPTSLPLASSGDGTIWQTVTAHRRRGSKKWIVLERGFDGGALMSRLEDWLATRPKNERGQFFIGEMSPGLSAVDVERELGRVDLVDGRMTYDGREFPPFDEGE